MRVIKSRYTYGVPKQGFWRCFADGQNISKVSVRFYESVALELQIWIRQMARGAGAVEEGGT